MKSKTKQVKVTTQKGTKKVKVNQTRKSVPLETKVLQLQKDLRELQHVVGKLGNRIEDIDAMVGEIDDTLNTIQLTHEAPEEAVANEDLPPELQIVDGPETNFDVQLAPVDEADAQQATDDQKDDQKKESA